MTQSFGAGTGTWRVPVIGWLFFAATIGQAALPFRIEADPVAAGYRDYYFGTSPFGTPTGEKPENKLWWNDGYWWGSLWDMADDRYHIHRFDVGSQSWINTGTRIDSRGSSKADALWDGNKLYVASHYFTLSPGPASVSTSGRVYRYSYNPTLDTYTLDSGFPVTVNSSLSEILVIDKDSSGKLWVTWVEAGKVKVNCTLGDDLTWGQPFDLPVQGSNVTTDDISSVAAMGGGRVGLMWSNQNDRKIYFAVHLEGNPATQWEPREEALADPVLGAVADDHINLKMSCDASGALYAATKTELTSAQQPLTYVLRRASSGIWSQHVFGRVTDNHTRPILCLDPAAGMIYVFAESNKVTASNPTGRGVIYMKSASVADLQFPAGLGTPFIDSPDDPMVNNPTSTKQCVSASSGILVAASDQTTRFYLHNYIDLGGPLMISFFTPESGSAGTEVEVHGVGFVNVQAVTFNGVAAVFTVESETLVRATVPAGTSTGPIAVTTPLGTATSAEAFAVIGPVIRFFTPVAGPEEQVVEVHGASLASALRVAFNNRTALFQVESDTLLRARVPQGANTGPISVLTSSGMTATSAAVFTVTGGSVSAPNLAAPGSLVLHQNRPNPFAAAGTAVSFDLPATASVRLVVYDAHGRKLRVLQDAQLSAGTHTTRWDGRDEAGTVLPNGLYFLRLEVPGLVRDRKLLLMR